jgi:CheY-like chemotaxis protein
MIGIQSSGLLLCDIGLPSEDGYSLLHQIRQLESKDGGKIPALALSAYTRPEDQQRLRAGAGSQPWLDKIAVFHRLIGGVREEEKLHRAYATELQIDLTEVKPAPACCAYTDFLLATAWRGSPGETLAAMPPCMRLYAFWRAELAKPQAKTAVRESTEIKERPYGQPACYRGSRWPRASRCRWLRRSHRYRPGAVAPPSRDAGTKT